MRHISYLARNSSAAFLVALTVFIFSCFASTGVEASVVVFIGDVDYASVTQIGVGGSETEWAVLRADRIQNNSPAGSVSGELRMELWAFQSPFSGSSQSGYKVAQCTLGTLSGGSGFSNVVCPYVPRVMPPNGTWVFTMILTEYDGGSANGGYATRDWHNFSYLVIVGTPVGSYLENPQPGSYQSGIGLISGWSCLGPNITYSIDGGASQFVPYGSARTDTGSVCSGNLNTGFGALVNFSEMGSGIHSVQMYANGVQSGNIRYFRVVAPSGSFLSGVTKEVTVPDFPIAGRSVTLIWQQATQNFGIKSVSP